jgi:hypothetical protein
MLAEVIFLAEFCFDCFKKIIDNNAEKDNVVLSKYKDYCEGCSKEKHVVITYKSKKSIFSKMLSIILRIR